MSTGDLDLIITRHLKAPRALVWTAWTDPKHLAKWWCPKPWTADVVKLDLKPGGAFHTIMHGPDGEEFDSPGAFLDVVPQSRIVFTSALAEGWRPVSDGGLPMTAIITMADEEGGTLYEARVLHADRAGREAHEKMGFYEGWGACISQLDEVAQALGAKGA